MVGRETAAARRSAADRSAARTAHAPCAWCSTRDASLGSQSQLVRTARETPVLVAVGAESSAADRLRLRRRRLRGVRLRGRHAGRAARRPAGRTGAAAVDQRAGRRRRPRAGQPVGRRADRRSSRLHRAETARRRRGSHGHRRPGNRRGCRRRCGWKRRKCGKWATTPTSYGPMLGGFFARKSRGPRVV